MQSIVVVAIWAVLRLLLVEHTIDFLMTPFLWVTWGMKGARESFTGLYPRLQSFLRRLESSNGLQSTITLVIDFQEAQCFFLIAVQIGILFATNQGSEFHANSTMFSLEENRRAAHDLASLGIALVCLVQMTLCRLRVDSTYILLLSTFVVALATATMEWGFNREHMATIVSSLQESIPVEQCGELGSLRFQCSGETAFVGTGMHYIWSGGHQSANQARVAMSYLGLVLVWAIKISRELSSRACRRDMKRYQRLSAWTRRLSVQVWVPVVASIIQFGLEFWLAFTVVVNLDSLIQHAGSYVDYVDDDGDSSKAYLSTQSWDIGQIIAILVWAPVLFRYMYVLLRKQPRPATLSQGYTNGCCYRRHRERLSDAVLKCVRSPQKRRHM